MRTVEPPASGTLLLARVRSFFVRFALLAAGVQLIELVDASTPVWPDRVAALLGTGVLVVWALRIGRSGRATWPGDATVVVALLTIGVGLGRNGAVLVALIAVLSLRVLVGTRRDATLVTAAVFATFGVVTTVLHGFGRVLDLNFLVIVAAAGALALTLRYLGELLAHHDLCRRLDEVATTTAARLVSVTTSADVDVLEAEARQRIRDLGDDPDVHHAKEAVVAVLRRTAADLRLARQRIATEARYRIVAEGNRDGVYLRATPVPGPDARYTYFNPAAAGILGVPVSDLIADPSLVRQRMHEDDHDRLTAAIDEDGLIAVPTEVRWRWPGGGWRWLRLEERVVEVDGDHRTVLGTLRDVTRQHEEAEALQRLVAAERAAADELRHLDAMKSTFLQAVSHELRTPLSAVIGAAQTLEARDEQLDADQRRRMLEIVQRQSSRLERLLTDLLDVDRLSRGLVSPERRRTSLRDLACSVVAALDPASAGRVSVVGDRAVIAVDGPKVERLIDNLVRNALRHTPGDSRVVCRLSSVGGVATVVVEDEGPGIPDELKTELFQPFAQGPAASGAPSPGTGIGLALVRALTELHGGTVRVEDRPGGGARFVVRLPADDPDPAAVGDPGPAAVNDPSPPALDDSSPPVVDVPQVTATGARTAGVART
ncbi:sensor histidine kinase [Nitriliruptor alkaliphilus]|uniref:sensor histidine kinase n=1 Tax=Nitriliruptor alkaliphilus TaxID=427918 RepID=UPI001FE141C8|nr:ATP-binding protein [Nitriliruptor alkaliphilus]